MDLISSTQGDLRVAKKENSPKTEYINLQENT